LPRGVALIGDFSRYDASRHLKVPRLFPSAALPFD
jgi:hypothetical protein